MPAPSRAFSCAAQNSVPCWGVRSARKAGRAGAARPGRRPPAARRAPAMPARRPPNSREPSAAISTPTTGRPGLGGYAFGPVRPAAQPETPAAVEEGVPHVEDDVDLHRVAAGRQRGGHVEHPRPHAVVQAGGAAPGAGRRAGTAADRRRRPSSATRRSRRGRGPAGRATARRGLVGGRGRCRRPGRSGSPGPSGRRRSRRGAPGGTARWPRAGAARGRAAGRSHQASLRERAPGVSRRPPPVDRRGDLAHLGGLDLPHAARVGARRGGTPPGAGRSPPPGARWRCRSRSGRRSRPRWRSAARRRAPPSMNSRCCSASIARRMPRRRWVTATDTQVTPGARQPLTAGHA